MRFYVYSCHVVCDFIAEITLDYAHVGCYVTQLFGLRFTDCLIGTFGYVAFVTLIYFVV